MKRPTLFAAVAIIVLKGIDVANAAELPSYESTGLPITALQVSVVGATHVQEVAPVPSLTVGGMPASLVQIEVLTPRQKIVGSKPQSRQQRAEATR